MVAPSFFTPWKSGLYSVAPALRPLGADFGNGDADKRLILIDSEFHRYRANKDAAYDEDRAKYWMCLEGLGQRTRAACEAISTGLAGDYPQHFTFAGDVLANGLTGERVAWDSRGRLDKDRSLLPDPIDHPLEALAMQIQADLALIARGPAGTDFNAAIHLCAPSHWAAADKIGKSFFESHAPIPGFSAVNAAASRLVDTLITKGPLVRFVWGVESDDRLNHHPVAPLGEDQKEWDGRLFDRGRFWVRTERQTTLGLPEVDATLFFIHVQTVPDTIVLQSPELTDSLRAGLLSMSPEARRYKGVEPGFEALIKLLDR